MKVAEYISAFLESKGIAHVFELSGGMITHIIDAMHERKKIQIISMHHEQGAAFAADGYARVSGLPGVALATSGPGATNLITGIASCYFDSVPGLFITGQVNINEQKGNKLIRQLGFQETDIISMVKPITKAAYSVKNADEIVGILHDAYELSISGRPGPVLIDIPMNIQRSEITVLEIQDTYSSVGISTLISGLARDIISKLKSSKSPLILAGKAVSTPKHRMNFRRFVDRLGVPVVTSLLAVDVLPYENPCRVGMIGTYGNRWANIMLADADFLIVIGSRLDIRQTGADVESFKEGKTIIHVDIDVNEINNRVLDCIPVNLDVSEFINGFLDYLGDDELPHFYEWKDKYRLLRGQYPDIDELKDISGLNPNIFMHLLSSHSKNAAAILADVGSHQMWAAQSFECFGDQYFLTSGGMGAMGFSLPAAIGACFYFNKPVLSISGDGGFQLNMQELQTIVRNKLPVKMVIINNNSLGMIRQFQDSYFNGHYPGTVWGYSSPDFCSIASAYGIRSTRINVLDDALKAINQLWKNKYEPFLLEVIVDKNTNVYPKIAFGRPISEMEPFAKPIDQEGT